MTLTLEIVGPAAKQLGEAARGVFTTGGGTIGRQADCDWVIAGPYISLQHARIHHRDGHYLLEDLSSNGVFVKSRENRLRAGELYYLQHGDRIFLDDVEVRVTVSSPAPKTEALRAPAFRKGPRAGAGDPAPLTAPLMAPADAVADALMKDSDAFLHSETEDLSVRHAADRAAEFALTRPTTGEFMADEEEGPPLPHTGEGPVGESMDFAALLLAAGLPQASITPELSRTLGHILQVVVDGLLDTLRSRETFKNDIGVRMTTFKPAHNNPLKFSANAEDALHNLFVKRNAAYLTPVEAFRDAFRELEIHQAALFAAAQDTLNAVRNEFDPQQLAREFDAKIKESSLLPVAVRLRYWDLFCEKFGGQGTADARGFEARWADRFSRAYMTHVDRLKNASVKAGQRRS